MPDVESNIKINISATQGNSSSNINKVKDALLGLKAVTDELEGGSIGKVADDLTRLADAIKTLETSKLASQLTRAYNTITKIDNSLSDTNNQLSKMGTTNAQIVDENEKNKVDATKKSVEGLANTANTLKTKFSKVDALNWAKSLSQTDILKRKLDEATQKLQTLLNAENQDPKAITQAAENVKKLQEALEKATREDYFGKMTEGADKAKDKIKSLADFMERIKEARADATQSSLGGLATKFGQLTNPIGLATMALNLYAKAAKAAFTVIKTVAITSLNYLKNLFTAVIKAGANLIKIFAKMSIALGKVAVQMGKAFGKVVLSPLNILGKAVSGLVNKLKTLFSALVRIATYRMFRSFIKMITKGLKDGIDNLYQWSKALDRTFSKAMDLYATDKQYLNNSFAAMLEPILETLIPLLDQITDKIVDFMNMFNQTLSALAGKTTWTKALKVATEYDEAAEDATKKTEDLKRSLLGFDEINRLDDPDKGSKKKGKTIPDYSSMFEELPIESKFKNFAKNIRELIKAGEWYAAGREFGKKLNELLETWNAEDTGKIIAKKINNAVDFARGLLTTANWRKLGSKISNLLNGLFRNVNGKSIGKALADTINGIFNFALGFFETADGAAIGKTLSDIINGFFEELNWEAIGKTVSEGFKTLLDVGIAYLKNFNVDALYDGILDIISSIKWAEIGNKLATFLNAAIGVINADKISQIIGNLFVGIADFINNSIGNLNIAEAVTKVIDIFTNLLTDGKTIKAISSAANTLLVKASEAISALISNFPISEIFNAIQTFVEGIDFDTIGTNIGTALQEAIQKIKPQSISGAITAVIDKAVDLLGGIADKMSETVTMIFPDENGYKGIGMKQVTYWEALGMKLGNALAEGIGNVDWSAAGETLNKLFTGIVSFVKTAIEQADKDGKLSNALVTLVNSIQWKQIAQDLIAIVKDTKGVLAEPLKQIGSSIAEAIGEAIKQWFKDNWIKILEVIATLLNPAAMIGFWVSKKFVKTATENTDWYEWLQEGEQQPVMPDNEYYDAWARTQQQSLTDTTTVHDNTAWSGSHYVPPTEQTINVNATVDGDVLFKSVVKTNNQTVKQTGQSPLLTGG